MGHGEWDERAAEQARRSWLAAQIDGRRASFVPPSDAESGYVAGAPGAVGSESGRRRRPGDRLRDGDRIDFESPEAEREWAVGWARATDADWRKEVAGTRFEGLARPRWQDLPASWQAAAIQEQVNRSVALARAEHGGLGTGDQLRDFLDVNDEQEAE